jgi:predicted tellurium resistance membrane protein TerC
MPEAPPIMPRRALRLLLILLAAVVLMPGAGPADAGAGATAAATASPPSLFSVESLVAFLTLASLEIVLGIDNIIFIAILAGKLPEHERDRARVTGLSLAVVTRILLLLAIGWVMKLDRTALFSAFGRDFTGKDLILLLGGLFLIGKATWEIHHKIEHAEIVPGGNKAGRPGATLATVVAQVLMIDLVFSLDSVLTAVGMTDQVPVMIAAILVSVGIMLAFSGPIVRFVDRHPAVKILALAFLILIGTLLVAEGFHQKLNKGYVYFAMAFAVVVELLQMKASPKPAASEAA